MLSEEIKVIDNFVEIEEQLSFKNYIDNNKNINYIFNTSSVTSDIKPNGSLQINYPQFTFPIYDIGPFIPDPIIFTKLYTWLDKNNLNNNSIFRIKMNTIFPFPHATEKNHGMMHQDMESKDYLSVIYYVNNSDGDTYFFKDNEIIKRVSPKQGRAVVFNSNIFHCASCPVNAVYRQAINFILKKG